MVGASVLGVPNVVACIGLGGGNSSMKSLMIHGLKCLLYSLPSTLCSWNKLAEQVITVQADVMLFIVIVASVVY